MLADGTPMNIQSEEPLPDGLRAYIETHTRPELEATMAFWAAVWAEAGEARLAWAEENE